MREKAGELGVVAESAEHPEDMAFYLPKSRLDEFMALYNQERVSGNWSYFVELFGLKVPATIEPKPGIPPSAKHVVKLVELMKKEKIGIVFAANYFDGKKARSVADRVGAEAVIVPLFVGGADGAEDYFSLVDTWINGLLEAAKKKDII